jgi:hypothetical protein
MPAPKPPPLTAIQDHFLQVVMPRVERHAQIYFRQHRRDPETMEELTRPPSASLGSGICG